MSHLHRGPSKNTSYQVSIHQAKRFQRRGFFQKSTNQKQELPVVAAMFVNGSERNEQSLQRTCHRCFLLSFGSFGRAVSEEKIFKNRPIRNMNCLWWPCLLMDRDKMSNLQRGPSMDASYQVSLHLAEGFQRRRLKYEKLTDDKRRTPSDGKSSHCLWQGELKKGPGGSMSQVVGFTPCFVNYKKVYTRLAAASDKVYKLLAHGRWFSLASSTNKTGLHDIAESGIKHNKSNQTKK